VAQLDVVDVVAVARSVGIARVIEKVLQVALEPLEAVRRLGLARKVGRTFYVFEREGEGGGGVCVRWQMH
jgi:hypothetical protein